MRKKHIPLPTSASIPLLIIAIGVVAVFGYFFMNRSNSKAETVNEAQIPNYTFTQVNEEGEETAIYTGEGEVLAGDTSPLLEFSESEYEAALDSGKTVLLFFYANWCPTCKIEFPKAEAAFNAITTDDFIGFRVNFDDNETTAAEEALAKEYAITIQHTKVIIVDGEAIEKTSQSWDRDDYLENLASAL